MARPHLPTLATLLSLSIISLLLCASPIRPTKAEATGIDQLESAEGLEWQLPASTMSILYQTDQFGDGEEEAEELVDPADGEIARRSLFWRSILRYYISYGALSANRIPCPPRSGRSYYTHNCYRAQGPVHPYTRGCSIITRCRM